jgi:hypothetical protein
MFLMYSMTTSGKRRQIHVGESASSGWRPEGRVIAQFGWISLASEIPDQALQVGWYVAEP